MQTLLFTIDREEGKERVRERGEWREGWVWGGGRERERGLKGLETNLKGGGMEGARVTVKPLLYLFRRAVVTVSMCWFGRCRCHLPCQH
jgi:hypothetical protein